MTGFKSKRLLSKGREVDLSGQRDQLEQELVDQIIALQKELLLSKAMIEHLVRMIKENREIANDGTSGETQGRR